LEILMLASPRLHTVRLAASASGNALQRRVRRISVRVVFGAALLVAASIMPVAAPANDDSWNIRIAPATKLMAAPLPMAAAGPGTRPSSAPPPAYEPPAPGAQAGTAPSGPAPMKIVPNRYEQVYRSIPFSHAEYAANPSYRQETAMGLLFNQFPYTSINKNVGVPRVPQYGYVTPYQTNTWYRTWTWSGTPPYYNSWCPTPGGNFAY
jgi:hypothetical protein